MRVHLFAQREQHAAREARVEDAARARDPDRGETRRTFCYMTDGIELILRALLDGTVFLSLRAARGHLARVHGAGERLVRRRGLQQLARLPGRERQVDRQVTALHQAQVPRLPRA